MTRTPAARRRALLVLFTLPGLVIASWITRTPDIRDLLGATTLEMGFVLFGLSIGSMLGILLSGPLVIRFGVRPVIVIGAIGWVASMPTLGIGAELGSPVIAGLGLFLFGAGMGTGEVAVNVAGADVEREEGGSFLPLLHGYFSLGSVVGAAAGMLATATGFSVLVHLLMVSVLTLAVACFAIPYVYVEQPDTTTSHSQQAGGRAGAVWRDPRLILICVVILALALAEGTANDWLPLVIVDGHSFTPAAGSASYIGFTAAMMVGRFVGGKFVDRFGRPPVLAASALFSVAGLALIAFANSPVVVVAAVLLWGLGSSLGFPVAISAAGSSGPETERRVAFAATAGYMAFLVGPPLLGVAGEEWGLRAALLIPLVCVLVAATLAPFIRSERSESPENAAPPERTSKL